MAGAVEGLRVEGRVPLEGRAAAATPSEREGRYTNGLISFAIKVIPARPRFVRDVPEAEF